MGRGVEGGAGARSLSVSERLTRRFTLSWLSSMGFPRGYFHGAFLDGAAAALQHAAGETLPALRPCVAAADMEAAGELVEAALRRRWVDACGSLEDAGLMLLCNIE